jgi:hypothetical protein
MRDKRAFPSCQRALVLFLLLVAMVLPAIALGHSHDESTKPCDVCSAGLLPALSAHGVGMLPTPNRVEWHAAPEEIHPDLDPLLTAGPSRAPPA